MKIIFSNFYLKKLSWEEKELAQGKGGTQESGLSPLLSFLLTSGRQGEKESRPGRGAQQEASPGLCRDCCGHDGGNCGWWESGCSSASLGGQRPETQLLSVSVAGRGLAQVEPGNWDGCDP